MTYELVIIWDIGGKSIYEYSDEDTAYEAGAGMVLALGDQIAYYCVREKLS